MHKPVLSFFVATSLVAPSSAIAATYDNSDVHPGTFVGARLQLSLGGKSSGKARAALAIAPTSSRVSDGAIVQTRIGEGLALNLGSRPSLTLAGMRADRVLGLTSGGEQDSGQKLGLSKSGWIAVGVGVGVVLIGAGVYAYVYDKASDNTD